MSFSIVGNVLAVCLVDFFADIAIVSNPALIVALMSKTENQVESTLISKPENHVESASISKPENHVDPIQQKITLNPRQFQNQKITLNPRQFQNHKITQKKKKIHARVSMVFFEPYFIRI
jgi:hypothetical protein